MRCGQETEVELGSRRSVASIGTVDSLRAGRYRGRYGIRSRIEGRCVVEVEVVSCNLEESAAAKAMASVHVALAAFAPHSFKETQVNGLYSSYM